ncbi:hypothetical protein QR98_0075720 [Sarcoptes scabiei]|uniref:C2H2-type domain-containing protein n=1 Tax=Sarcoptes scabiei TaxID=52283 RepID=A0A132ADJ4_SARSC|nr:hypothetical protein QR98_0075720 [Sarcoptes scabiei]
MVLQPKDIESVENGDEDLMKQSNNSKKKFQCPYENCLESFTKKIRLRTHIHSVHTNFKPYVCTESNCFASFACAAYLSKHLKRHRKNSETSNVKRRIRKFNCTECEKIFPTKIQLKLHQSRIHSISAFRCDQCDAGFIYRSKLNAHKRRHRGYRCSFDTCSFQTNKWSELRKHVSEDHRRLICPDCSKSYSTPYNLRLHQSTVHNQTEPGKLFICKEDGCEKSYNRLTSLQNHIRAAHSVPKHFCSECKKSFRYKTSLNHHIQSSCPSLTKHSESKQSKKRKPNLKSKLKKLIRIKPLFDEEIALEEIEEEESNRNRSDSNDRIDLEKLIESNLMQSFETDCRAENL